MNYYIKKSLRLIMRLLPWAVRDYIFFRWLMGYFPKIREPRTFCEKLLKRKRTQCQYNNRFSIMGDKFLVRSYISLVIGNDNIVPIIDVYTSIKQLKRDILNFHDVVIKPSHASGEIIYINDYLTVAEAQAVLKKAANWLKLDFSKTACEYHYKKIPKKIIVEKRIDSDDNPLKNYKFHIFNSRVGVNFVLHINGYDRQDPSLTTTYVNNLEQQYKGDYIIDDEIKSIVEEAKNKSFKLAYSLDYARIDWYIHDGNLFFSEITLTPAAGFLNRIGRELDQKMGEFWEFKHEL